MATITIALPARELDYPESDGKPMAETEVHLQVVLETIAALQDCFRMHAEMHVGGGLLLYYEEGNPGAVVAPDVFVVWGIDKSLRRSYKLWEEQHPPTVVIEITSRSTRLEDLGNKRVLYASLGVQEYFLFDPLAEYLRPPVQGYRLVDGDYVRLEADSAGVLASQELGLGLQREDSRLRLVDTATRQRLLWLDEVGEARRTEVEARLFAEEQARAEATARSLAEERLAATEAELAQIRAELARLREDPSTDDE